MMIANRIRGFLAANRPSAVAKLRRAVYEKLEKRELLADIGGGLVANYYADANFTNLAAARTDATVNFDWGTGSPAAGVPAEGFSARWTGQITAPATSKYTLSAESAGSIKVTIDGKAIITDTAFHARRTATGSFSFTAGQYYNIQIDFKDKGAAAAKLSWKKDGGAQQIVPQANLFRLGTGFVSNGWNSADFSGTRSVGASNVTSTGATFVVTGGGVASGPVTRAAGGVQDLSKLAYKTLRGDGEITVKLNSASSGTEADVVFRKDLTAGSPFVDLSVLNGKVSVQYRETANGAIKTNGSKAVSGAVFLKLKRDGNSFAGYVSTTGADNSWTLVGTAGVFMDTFAQAGFGVTGGANTRAAFSNPSVVSKPQLGVNLHHIYDSSVERPFVDVLKLNGGFRTLAGAVAPTDSAGWPTIPEFQVQVGGAGFAIGKYTVVFTGPANATVLSKSGAKLTKVSYNAATKEHLWTAEVLNGQKSLFLAFKGMVGWGKNLRLLQPGYSHVNTPIYTTRFLNFVKAYGPASIRFMDWTLTNKVTMSDWSQRPTLQSANWAKVGVPWEACVELANLVNANAYLNVPGRANDDYIRQMAAVVKARLRPDLNVYLEQGNEMWATNFANGNWNTDQAKAEVAKGGSNLNYDKKTNRADLWALRRTARRAKQIGDIFKQVFMQGGGADPINKRVRVMVAAQVAQLNSYTEMLKYLNDVYGKPGNYIYAMAAAPYFTMGTYNDKFVGGKWTTLNSKATPDMLLGTMELSAGSYTKQNKYTTFWSYGKPFGVQLAMYEGGHDTFGPFNIQAKKAATNSARMKTMMKGYLSQFFVQGGSVFHYYTLGADSYDGIYGTWSITNDFANTNTAKSQAFKEVRTGNLGNASPSAGVFG